MKLLRTLDNSRCSDFCCIHNSMLTDRRLPFMYLIFYIGGFLSDADSLCSAYFTIIFQTVLTYCILYIFCICSLSTDDLASSGHLFIYPRAYCQTCFTADNNAAKTPFKRIWIPFVSVCYFSIELIQLQECLVCHIIITEPHCDVTLTMIWLI